MDGLIPALETLAVARSLPKNSIALFQGEVPNSAYIIKKGLIKAYSINKAGNEQIAAFYGPGDIFPITWIFNKSSSTLYYYETLSDTQVLMVSKEALRQQIYHDPKLMNQVIDYNATQYTASLLRITALEQARATEKLMFIFYYLIYRYGEPGAGGKYSLKMSLTHNLIADMVGLTRETVNSELNKLKKLGIISYKAKHYIIDKPALERLMGEESFSNLLK